MKFMNYPKDMNLTKRHLRTRLAHPPPRWIGSRRTAGSLSADEFIGDDRATTSAMLKAILVLVADALLDLEPPHPGNREIDLILGRLLRTRLEKVAPGLLRAPQADEKSMHAAAEMVEAALLDAARSLHGHVGDARDEPWTSNEQGSDPLQAARERGKHLAVQEWEKPENLTLKDAAAYAGRSDRMINLDRQAGRLYALVPPGKERGFRYPRWQFNVDPARLEAALAPFINADASCWVVHNFMLRPVERLEGKTPSEWIANPTMPIESLVRLAEARYLGDQGAA